MKKYFALFLSFVILFAFVLPTQGFAQASSADDENRSNALFSSMFYNFNTGKIMFDEELALESYNFSQEELDSYSDRFDNLSPEDTTILLNALGVDLVELKKQTLAEQEYDGPQQRLAPLVIAALAFLGGAAAGKIIDEATTYGIVKTCQKYKNGYAWFVDYCETNGHI